MATCDSCGTLLEMVRTGDSVEHRCPDCDPGSATETSYEGAVDADVEAAGVRSGDAPPGAGRFFPFEDTRPGQARFLSDVRDTLKSGDVLVAQVPTGVGKTAGVLSPALEVAARSGSTVFFLTSKQSQHKVAVETLSLTEQVSGTDIVVSDMISKKAMCPRPESEQLGARAFGEFCSKAMAQGTCDYYETDEESVFRELARDIHHVEDAVELSEREHVCPYKALTEVARVADVVVLDYNHFFSDLVTTTMDRFQMDLSDAILVVDEAHNLPDRIRSHLTWRLTPGLLGEASDEARTHGAHPLARFLDRLADLVQRHDGQEEQKLEPEALLDPIDELLEKAFRLAQPDLHELLDELHDVAEVVRKEEAVSACGEVTEFLERWPGKRDLDEDAVLRMWEPEATAFTFKVLDAGRLAGPILSQVQGAVLMSGTLYPMGMYAGILGVPNDRARLERYQNPFPEENRKVAIDPGVSSKATERGPQMYRRIASTIQDVAKATPGNVAAFFPSYKMMSNVETKLGRSSRRRLVEERSFDKEERESLVNRLERADGNALMLGVQGGSLSEGYDFEADGENLLKSVLVVGVPYAPPTTEVESLQSFFDERFGDGKGWQYGYLAPAIQRTLQAAGRAVRAAHHEAFVGLLDRRFSQRQIQSWLPPDMNPHVEQDLPAAAERFFS